MGNLTKLTQSTNLVNWPACVIWQLRWNHQGKCPAFVFRKRRNGHELLNSGLELGDVRGRRCVCVGRKAADTDSITSNRSAAKIVMLAGKERVRIGPASFSSWLEVILLISCFHLSDTGLAASYAFIESRRSFVAWSRPRRDSKEVNTISCYRNIILPTKMWSWLICIFHAPSKPILKSQ
jgi:hypothetical protein